MNIDRELAENVMGYKRVKKGDEYYRYESESRLISYSELEWKPSQLIVYAMEVEAEMFRRGWESDIDHRRDSSVEPETEEFIVTFFKMMPYREGVGSDEKSPKAICLAALEAIGQQGEDDG